MGVTLFVCAGGPEFSMSDESAFWRGLTAVPSLETTAICSCSAGSSFLRFKRGEKVIVPYTDKGVQDYAAVLVIC